MLPIDVSFFAAPAFSLRLGSQAEFRFDGLNDILCQLTGLRREAMIGRTPAECLPPEAALHVETQYRRCVETRAVLEYEERLELPGGAKWWRTTLTPLVDPVSGAVTGIFGLTMDITEAKLAELDLRSAAFKDPLTGICNRRRFDHDLEYAVARANDTGRAFAVILADVDRLKPINDTHGHGTGDEVLKEIARRLATGIRETDRLARIGGDEFAAIVSAGSDGAVTVALERMARKLAGPIRAGGLDLAVGVRLGAALWRPGLSTAEIMAAADGAMYREKAALDRAESRGD